MYYSVCTCVLDLSCYGLPSQTKTTLNNFWLRLILTRTRNCDFTPSPLCWLYTLRVAFMTMSCFLSEIVNASFQFLWLILQSCALEWFIILKRSPIDYFWYPWSLCKCLARKIQIISHLLRNNDLIVINLRWLMI